MQHPLKRKQIDTIKYTAFHMLFVSNYIIEHFVNYYLHLRQVINIFDRFYPSLTGRHPFT